MPQTGQTRSVLVIDDNDAMVDTLKGWLKDWGYIVATGSTAAAAIKAVKKGHHGVIFLDLGLPDEQGLSILERLQALNPANRIIVITGNDEYDVMMSATNAGAFDFITKGGDGLFGRVLASTRNAFAAMDNERTIEQLSGGHHGSDERQIQIVSKAPAMKPVLAGIQQLAKSRVSVLIQGASGTGKEVVARSIHAGGPRRDERFIAVNCAGIPDNLLESELLGYERGAFTGAVTRKIGKFELANGGTIFLDEIGEMSLPLQAKILRVVQDGRFERLGGTKEVSVDVRVISATNRDLSQMVAENLFREDLYYRLAVFTLDVPDLASRTEDIEQLARDFLEEACAAEGRKVPVIAGSMLHLLLGHPWPGNVRQLHNVMSHAAVVCNSEQVTIHHLPSSFARRRGESNGSAPEARPDDNGRPQQQVVAAPAQADNGAEVIRIADRIGAPLSVEARLDRALQSAFPGEESLPSIAELKKAGIRLTMTRLKGNRKQTALRLGISRATLYRMLDEQPELAQAPDS